MKKAAVCILFLLLCCSACCAPAPAAAPEAGAGAAHTEALHLARAQLGRLAERVSEREEERVVALLERIIPLRQARQASGGWQPEGEEARLVAQLNRLYERYTARYLGDGGGWDSDSPADRVLAEYWIQEDETLRPDPESPFRPDGDREVEYEALWAQMRGLLPEGSWAAFSRFTVFTDGADETLAYVAALDGAGERWEIAVDPADAGDGDWFTETVLHEYTHYLTLNAGQVTYTAAQTADTYNEEGMAAAPGSYLDDFYQAFWSDYLDDRRANPESDRFFLRHEDDFVTDYAATDPSEDIAESFTYFVLWPRQGGGSVWEQKLDFFYGYPELVELRAGIRTCLGLAERQP